jgi:D-arabinose 1-dehydrogenase-like Zn-dependent alcohol dehydrogenase
MIPSHEPAGKIVQVGPHVKGAWKVGDRVGVLNFKKACAECVGCRQHIRKKGCTDPRFCERREMAGFKHNGAFAEYMVADPVVCYPAVLRQKFEYCIATPGVTQYTQIFD